MRKHIEKRVLALALVGVLSIGAFTGCGKKKGNSATEPFEYNVNDYVTLGAYTGLDVTEEITNVTDADIEEEIEKLVEDAITYEEVTDRAIEAGDRVTIDYTRGIKGNDEEATGEEAFVIELGTGKMSEEFEQNLIGLSKGESKAFEIKEEESQDTVDEKGEVTDTVKNEVTALYSVDVTLIEKKVVPEVTDEFIAEQTEQGYTTIEDYKKGKRAELEENNANSAKSTAQSELLNMIIESSEVSGCPAFLFNMSYNTIYQNYALYGSYFGYSVEEYMSNCGVTDEDIRKQAVQGATETLVIEAICKAADIDVTDEQFDENLQKYVTDYGFESTDAVLEKYSKDELIADMRRDVAINYIYENNNVTQTHVDGE